MSNRIGKVAVVIGTGVGGLTAARALSDHFDQVEVIENDTLPQFSAALARRASEDAHVHKTMLEVQHLLKPRSALKELQSSD
jgi:NADH dehydrogenase FAD-containing subunit